MLDSTSAPLTMPRRLAIRLLHEAQIATDGFSGLVSASSDPASEPEGWLPMTAGDTPAALSAQLEASGKRAWALYFFRPSLPSMPVASDFAHLPSLLRLTASLATRGVLQLRAWQCVDGKVSERELHVHD